MVSKCLFCFDLKLGYYTYIIIIAGIRISIFCYFYHYLPFLCTYSCETSNIGWPTGWFAASVLFCLIAIVGIVQNRSIIVYPYIIILVTELLVTTISLLFISIFLESILFIVLFVILGFYGYDLWCLISLYMKIKKMETETTNFIDHYEQTV